MPDRMYHRTSSRNIDGRPRDDVHAFLDSTVKSNPGKRHRDDIVHEPIVALAVLGPYDPTGATAAHILRHMMDDENITVKQGRQILRAAGIHKDPDLHRKNCMCYACRKAKKDNYQKKIR